MLKEIERRLAKLPMDMVFRINLSIAESEDTLFMKVKNVEMTIKDKIDSSKDVYVFMNLDAF